MRSRLWLILWIVGILFPMAFLGRVWPAFGRLFGRVFAADLTHILFHTFLYAVLAVLLGSWSKPAPFAGWVKILGLVFLVGLLHEGIQVALAGGWPGWPAEAIDLGVDLGGGAMGLACLSFFLSPHAKNGAQESSLK